MKCLSCGKKIWRKPVTVFVDEVKVGYVHEKCVGKDFNVMAECKQTGIIIEEKVL